LVGECRDQGEVVSGPSWDLILPKLIPLMRKQSVTVQLVADRFGIPTFEALQILNKIRSSYACRSWLVRQTWHFKLMSSDDAS
tara:strand:- start:1160 stop:1408 length:249 start_codon:yes stop_codon:yes gene_type:complete